MSNFRISEFYGFPGIVGVTMKNYKKKKKEVVSTSFGTNICRRLSGQNINQNQINEDDNDENNYENKNENNNILHGSFSLAVLCGSNSICDKKEVEKEVEEEGVASVCELFIVEKLKNDENKDKNAGRNSGNNNDKNDDNGDNENDINNDMESVSTAESLWIEFARTGDISSSRYEQINSNFMGYFSYLL